MLLQVFLLLFLCSCAQPRLQANLPEIQNRTGDSDHEQLYETPHYNIATTSSRKTAMAMGSLLESLYGTCSELLPPATDDLKQLSVYAFTSKDDYEAHIDKHKLQVVYASGFYTPAEPAGIYLPLTETNGVHPFFTLAHEGLHQYIHEIKGIQIPATSARLPAVPLWLNEGLALNMEAALVNEANFQPGRIHPPRLDHLQRMIEAGGIPSVKEVLSKTYGEPFTNEDYSVAWGVTYFLLNQKSLDNLCLKYWSALQEKLKYEASLMVKNKKFPTSKDLIRLQTLWADHLQATAARIFMKQVVGQGQNWTSFQKHWEKAILQLTSTQE